MYGVLSQIETYLSKMRSCPQFSFWIPRVISKIYFLRIVLNHANIPVLVSITHRKPEYLEMRKKYAQ